MKVVPKSSRDKYKARMRRRAGDSASTRGGRGENNTRAARSMQEVADILGVSRQAVHQVERNALYKLRLALLPCLREINPELAASYEEAS